MSRSTDEIYIDVIEIIRSEPDLKLLFFELCKHFPEAVIDAYSIIRDRGSISLEDRVIAILRGGADPERLEKIKAIKYVRAETSEGLKEAKEYVEDLIRKHKME